MEEMASLWCYQETMDEMRQKLLYTNLELEKLKVEMNEEMMKNKSYVKQLIQLLKIVCEERDEAKNQLQKLLNNTTKSNSSITESNSHSETYNYYSSPVVDTFFDTVSSPEFSNINMADSNYVPEVIDKGTFVIDSFVKGKNLPEKGKLLKTVIEAGPLLQTLLVSGQLPQWRNPPHLTPFNIPTVSVKGVQTNQYLGATSSQMLSTTSMLNFGYSDSGSCLENQRFANLDSFVRLGKRQRLQ